MKKIKPNVLLLIVFCIPVSLLSFADQDSDTLSVHVTGAIANTGQIFLSLYTSKKTYLKKPMLQERRPTDGEGEAWFTISDLQAGTYSVSIFYDEDNDGELDTGFMRIPKEPVGFSNNAKGRFGPPAFDKTSFDFPEFKEIIIDLVRIRK